MLNQTILVGKLVKDLELRKDMESFESYACLPLEVKRSYKNAEGIYEADFIDCVLYKTLAENTAEYCKKGDIIVVKGRLQTNVMTNEKGEKVKITQVIAEKVTFLASRKSNEE